MGSAFVFDPDASYGRVDAIREENEMPEGAHLVASVTGPWKIVSIVDYDGLTQLPGRVEGLAGQGGGSGDPETATTVLAGFSKVKRTVYANEMAFVRIQVRGDADPMGLLDEVEAEIGSNEVDAVVGAFDIFACAVADDETSLAAKILGVRAINGVRSTASLRVIDFVSADENAPVGHRIPA
jgi:hypothetical protein